MTPEEIREGVKRRSPWFYEFDLGGGISTPSALPPEVRPIHTTRLEMVCRAVEAHFGARLPQTSAFDAGCHEGYFAMALAQKGLRRAIGRSAL